MSVNWEYLQKVVISTAFLLLFCGAGFSEEKVASGVPNDDTLLLFVGEDIEVLTLATRREEGAAKAPAVATVITREQIREAGHQNVADALATVPGFQMAQKEGGVLPYMRGISNSALTLFDTIPMASDTDKSINQLDATTLAGVKRIEVIRGPGSVLWGPDAFAGIVNIVPMSGRDMQGVETGISYGAPGDQVSTFVNAGYASAGWDGFFSLNARAGQQDDSSVNLLRFWGEDSTPVPPDERLGRTEPDRNYHFEAVGQINLGSWLNMTGRLSRYQNNYAMSSPDTPYTWCESKTANAGFIKVDGNYKIDLNSVIRLNVAYSFFNPDHTIIDETFSQKEFSHFGELLYDRTLFGDRGIITTGISYRKKGIENAPVWDGYLPDYLLPENTEFKPTLTLVDYDTTLQSVFGQYTFKLQDVDFLLGARYDHHDSYASKISYNSAAVWHPGSTWIFKLLYGTAYRTPYSRQLYTVDQPDLEEIRTLSFQANWQPAERISASATVFTNWVNDHVMQDPYAGLSEPNHQEINGIELGVKYQLSPVVDLTANLTLLNAHGPDEIYKYNDYTIILPDGTEEKHYIDLVYPYDPGAETLLNLGLTWRPSDRFSCYAVYRYFSKSQLAYPRGATVIDADAAGILDLTCRYNTIINRHNATWDLIFKNLTDSDYNIPGTYNLIQGDSLEMQIRLSVDF